MDAKKTVGRGKRDKELKRLEGKTISKYSENSTQFKDLDCLVKGLVDIGFDRSEIEVHEEAQPLKDYHGNKTHYLGQGDCDRAEIIIRQKHVNHRMQSGASNDFGFKRNPNGTYSAIISEYDSRYFTQPWLTKLKVNYAHHGMIKQGAKSGLRYVGFTPAKTVNGKRQLHFVQA